MSAKSTDIIRESFYRSLKANNLARKGNAFYLSRDDTILVFDLQRSQYGPKYYINIAVWLRDLGEAEFPKENVCHIKTRLESLVEGGGERISKLLDLDFSIADETRESELGEVLRSTLYWVQGATESLATLRSPAGQQLLRNSLVMGPAQRLIQGTDQTRPDTQ